jgi:SNF2 family DNA or RNA helicase
MSCGTGKTIVSIAVSSVLWQQGKIRRVLIVAPLSIVSVWQEEFEKFADFDYNLAVLTGSGIKKAETLRKLRSSSAQVPSLQVAVVNYESAWRLEDEILAWKPDLVISDEAHKIKQHTINASKSMHRIGARAAYRLLLTGTLITNKALDVFSPYKFLNPSIFGSNFYQFRNRYFSMEGYGGYTPVLKQSMEPELLRKLHSIAFRANKADCLDLPETTDIIRYVSLEPGAARIYRDLVKDSYAELNRAELGDTEHGDEAPVKSDITVTNILSKLLRLSQLTGGFLRGDEDSAQKQVSTVKLDALADIIDSVLEDGEKLVIIARFIPEIDAIQKLLEAQGIGYSLIKGGVKDRSEEVSKFQTDLDIKVFVGQIATAGLGITLTAASTMVFYSCDYSMANFEQARARIHRVGQKHNCTYIYLTARSTCDEKVLQALRDKADLARTMVDDYHKGLNPFV